MRKLIVSMHMSLDGFIEGERGDVSWINTTDRDNWSELFDLLKTVDLFVLGRAMWPGYRDHWKHTLTNPSASADELAYARIAEKTKHVIFSKTIVDSGWENSTVEAGDIAESVKKLKQQPGKDIVTFGGAMFAKTLIDAGLVDEFRLCVTGAIVAKGKSLFAGLNKKSVLQLVESKTLASGLIILRYRTVYK